MHAWFQLIGGGVLLYFAAEWFVGGASALAAAMRIPPIVVGLTVVAFGTSAPEVVVGVEAARAGHGAVALGNVIGSNIANIGLILGLATLIRPARVHGSLRRRELPMLVGSTAAVPILLLDGRIERVEALGLIVVAVLYTGSMIRTALHVDVESGSSQAERAATLTAARIEARAEAEAADIAGAPTPTSRLRAFATAGAGLAALLVAGQLFVDGAVTVARELGLSERLVGLTIVAIGTSLPELVTSVVAARRGHSDLAVGNVVGSNIFNVLLCLGTAGLAGFVGAPLGNVALELAALVVMTLLAAIFLRGERLMSRVEGAAALMFYVLFSILMVFLE
jgi:cation:H+ antiporter